MASTSLPKWQQSTITFFEVASNLFVYVFALLVIVIPPLKWLSDVFPSTSSPLWVIAAIIVFVFVLPIAMELFTHFSLGILEKFRNGQLLPVIVRPFKAICAALTMYGLLSLEYKVIHGHNDVTVLELYWQLIQAL